MRIPKHQRHEKTEQTTAKGGRQERVMVMEKGKAAWEEIDETELTIAERCVYRIRRQAVGLYLEGNTAGEIFRVTGLNHTAVVRLWNKCCAVNPETGRHRGFAALVPRSKIKKFIR